MRLKLVKAHRDFYSLRSPRRARIPKRHAFDQVDDFLHGVRLRHAPRVGRHRLQFGGPVQQSKNFLRQTFRGELGLGDEPRRACLFHFLGVAQLVAVRGCAEGDEDGGASGGGDLGGGNGAGAANDQIGLGESLGHVPDEGENLRVDFAARIGHANRIIVALAGLVNDRDAMLLRGEQVRRVHQRAVDDEGALAASGNQQMKWFSGRARRNGEELGAYGNSRESSLRSPKPRRRAIGCGDARRHAGEHAVGEARLRVGLEHHGWQSAQHGGQHHRPGGVSPDAQRRYKPVPAQNRKRIPHRRGKFRRIAREFHPPDALEPRRANRLQSEPRLGHQPRFNPALRSHEHDFPFSFSRPSFPGHGECRKYVAARAPASY